MINSIKKTLAIIRKNKSKVLLIFFLQIIFFLSLTLIFQQQIIPAMNHARNAIDYYDEINITEDPGMFDYLGEEPLTIFENYTQMMVYLKFMALYSILSFIIINGLVWTFSDNLINKKTIKQSLNYLLNFTILTLSFAALFYLLIFKTLKSSLIKLESTFLPLVGALFLFIVLVYFLYIGFTLIDKRKTKDIFKIIFIFGIKKFPKIILIHIINLFIISLFAYLLYLTIELNIILLSIAVLLFIFSFVFTRIYLIISVNSLVKKK